MHRALWKFSEGPSWLFRIVLIYTSMWGNYLRMGKNHPRGLKGRMSILIQGHKQWLFLPARQKKYSWFPGYYLEYKEGFYLSSVQLLSRVRLFATPWIGARQASLSITNSRSLLKLMPIKLVMPSSHLILCCPLLLLPPIPPSIRVFPMSQHFTWGGQSIGVSASASVLPMNTQDWSPLGQTGWISLESKGLSRVFSNTTVQKHQLFSTQLSSQSNSHIHTWPLEKP